MTMEKATFAAGCFWGVEAAFRALMGVISTTVGYSGGTMVNPTYVDVCRGNTGHAEVVEVLFDPSIISFQQLLNTFWEIHDPTHVDRQGVDIGSQYRSAIFYHNEEQLKIATESKNKLQKSSEYKRDIATEIVAASKFYRAEDYHQQYYKSHTVCPTRN
jgi:peptide-methionine (S)-S-oxide reductase